MPLCHHFEFFAADKKWSWESLKSVEQLQTALQLDDDFLFQTYLTSGGYVGSYYEKAVEFLQKALAIRPDSVLAKSMLAWVYYEKGDVEQALMIYRELAQQAPNLAEPFFKRQPDIFSLLQSATGQNP